MKKLTNILQEIEIIPVSLKQQIAKLFLETDTDKMLKDPEFMEFFNKYILNNIGGIYGIPSEQLFTFYRLLKKVNRLQEIQIRPKGYLIKPWVREAFMDFTHIFSKYGKNLSDAIVFIHAASTDKRTVSDEELNEMINIGMWEGTLEELISFLKKHDILS